MASARRHELTREQARRIAVRAQLLDAERPSGVLDVVRHLTGLQVDLTAAVAPSVDLVLWSRLGPAYRPEDLDRLLDNGALVELQLTLRPAEDLALYRADMADWPGREPLAAWQAGRAAWAGWRPARTTACSAGTSAGPGRRPRGPGSSSSPRRPPVRALPRLHRAGAARTATEPVRPRPPGRGRGDPGTRHTRLP